MESKKKALGFELSGGHREDNAPEPLRPLIPERDVSVAVDNSREPDAHRRRTVRDVDSAAVRREVEIAEESRRTRLRWRLTFAAELFIAGGAAAGWIALGAAIWRWWGGR